MREVNFMAGCNCKHLRAALNVCVFVCARTSVCVCFLCSIWLILYQFSMIVDTLMDGDAGDREEGRSKSGSRASEHLDGHGNGDEGSRDGNGAIKKRTELLLDLLLLLLMELFFFFFFFLLLFFSSSCFFFFFFLR